MCSDPRDALATANFVAVLTRLLEKIDAAMWPIHPTCAIRELPRAAKFMLEVTQ